MRIEKEPYNIGIDIGTNSVGWAVLNLSNQLLKIKKKNMWGSHIFDAADSAVERRQHRGSRRRYNRRRERVQWLDTFFISEALKKDPLFKERIKNISFLDKEDKENEIGKQVNFNLFEDENYTDKKYYREYPTVYHLRDMLCEKKEKQDPRFVYLALHHIIKYRGNFLYEGQQFSINDNEAIIKKMNSLFQRLEENYNIYLNVDYIDKIIEVLKKQKNKSQKVSDLQEVSKDYKGSKYASIFKLLVGLQAEMKSIFDESFIGDDNKEIKIKFSDSKYDEEKEKYEAILEDKMEIINLAYEIYSWVELQEVLNGKTTLSKAMIEKYEKHQKDLQELKKLFSKYLIRDEYKEFFKSKNKKKKNYYAYINNPKEVNQEAINKEIKNKLEKIEKNLAEQGIEDVIVSKLLEEAKEEKLLPKQTSTDNSVIPYQLHLKELEMILNNQKKYYPTLEENYDKLRALVTFRMPYYVGPISPEQTPFSWAKRNPGKEKERILPWSNLEDIINIDATAMEFIRRMTNKCTYLFNEEVLPKKSLYIAKYEVLNELNKLQINGKFIDQETKKQIYNELFLTKKKVTEKHIKDFYSERGLRVDEIKGMQKENEFASSLEPWIDFTKIFGNINHNNMTMIEDIILWLTVFEDTKICERKIRKEYSEITNEQISKILSLKSKYKGWSRLSKKLLVDIKSMADQSILDVLENSNDNFMQVINNKKLGFDKQLEAALNQHKFTFNKELLTEIQGSPAIKRGIWRSLKIVKEIIKVMGYEPENIFVEFAREEGEKQRTQDRIKRLEDLYKKIKEDVSVYNETVAKELKDRKDLNQEKVYLYFLQMGRCMYTNEPIDLDNLSGYDVDHIIPRFLKKDDSFDNKVLVKKLSNQRKKDDIVLDTSIISRQKNYWKKLKDNGLMSSQKYDNLMRTSYSEQMVEGFINRQLVETRQISKQVVKILKDIFPTVNISSVRAPLVSEFRNKYNIYKLREVNDYHHAHDAYIIAILGYYLIRKYPDIYNGKFNSYKKEFINNKLLKDNYSIILSSMNRVNSISDTGEVIWNPDKIANIKKTFYYTDCFITRKLEPQTGDMFKVTILPGDKKTDGGKTNAKIPVNKHRKDLNKYGGMTGMQYAYYYLVKYQKNKKTESVVVGIPIQLSKLNMEEQIHYLQNELETEYIQLLSDKIYKYQFVLWHGQPHYMTGPNELMNARQLILNEKQTKVLSDSKNLVGRKQYQKLKNEDINELYDYILEKYEKYYKTYDKTIKKLVGFREKFYILPPQNKVLFIIEMLKFSKANAKNLTIKFKSIELTDEQIKVLNVPENLFSSRGGRLNEKTIHNNEAVFINQSITGIYQEEKRYELEDIDDN